MGINTHFLVTLAISNLFTNKIVHFRWLVSSSSSNPHVHPNLIFVSHFSHSFGKKGENHNNVNVNIKLIIIIQGGLMVYINVCSCILIVSFGVSGS